MLRSMDSAISGMQAFQTDLDVVGNNIANVNTIGFKSGRADFADLFSQMQAGASSGSSASGLGGTNPQQVGLGTKIAAINTLFTQGADSTTGVATDVAINGPGLFIVSPNPGSTTSPVTSTISTPPTTPSATPPAYSPNSTLYFSRAGNFTMDASGNLVLPNGMVLMCSQGTTKPTGKITLTAANIPQLASDAKVTLGADPNLTIGPDGSINVVDNKDAPQVLGYIPMATFSNYGGLVKNGDSLYSSSANANPGGVPTAQFLQTAGFNTSVQAGALEMSNVDLTKEFSEMIVAQNGFAANSKMIGTDNQILQDVVNMKNS